MNVFKKNVSLQPLKLDQLGDSDLIKKKQSSGTLQIKSFGKEVEHWFTTLNQGTILADIAVDDKSGIALKLTIKKST